MHYIKVRFVSLLALATLPWVTFADDPTTGGSTGATIEGPQAELTILDHDTLWLQTDYFILNTTNPWYPYVRPPYYPLSDDWWHGDDELRQHTDFKVLPDGSPPPPPPPPGGVINAVPDASVEVEVSQKFEMTTWLTSESGGLGSNHIHPKVAIEGKWTWTYTGPLENPTMAISGKASGRFDMVANGVIELDQDMFWGGISGFSSATTYGELEIEAPDDTKIVSEKVQFEGIATINTEFTHTSNYWLNGELQVATSDDSPPTGGGQVAGGASSTTTTTSVATIDQFSLPKLKKIDASFSSEKAGNSLSVGYEATASIIQSGAVDDGTASGDASVVVLCNLDDVKITVVENTETGTGTGGGAGAGAGVGGGAPGGSQP